MRIPKNKQSLKVAALWLAFFVGIAIMAYPFVSNAIFQWRADRAIAALSSAVDDGNSEAYEAERQRAESFNRELVGQTVPDVFAIREGTTDPEYEGLLNVAGDQMIGTIQIPVIDVSLPIFHYSTEETLLKGCGHIFGSSLPVGGASTHAVITAHRGLPAAKLFTDLDQVEEGDRFYLKVLDQTLAYEVDHIEVVKPTETRSLAIQRGEDLVTLVTCTPYGVNTSRLLVRGHRVAYEAGDETAAVAPHGSQIVRWLIEAACVVAGVLVALGIRAYGRHVRAREDAAAGKRSRGRVRPAPMPVREQGAASGNGRHFRGSGGASEVPPASDGHDAGGSPDASSARRGRHFRA